MDPNENCPCHSGIAYIDCCRRYHLGKLPQNAVLLMRSRYSAYALGLSDYIIDTTHPENPEYAVPRELRLQGIERFSKGTHFKGLEIIDFFDEPDKAYVKFRAILEQGGKDVSFTENSQFKMWKDKWLYVRAIDLR